MMTNILKDILQGRRLSKAEASHLLRDIAAPNFNDAQIVAILSAFCMRQPNLEEIEGFQDALYQLCIKVDLGNHETLDLCGTGGDGKDTFNISTLASLVVAGCGVKVVKHGNYSASSTSGSSNVLEELGVAFRSRQEELLRDLESAGICFLHAPLFHPALKVLAPLRKEVGIRTFFNILGPLTNPASPAKQFTGVASPELARLYTYFFQRKGKGYSVVHSLDGYDEISLTGPFKVHAQGEESLFEPEDLGFKRVDPQALANGGSLKRAAEIFREILRGKGSEEQRAVVIANAGFALQCARPTLRREECFAMARGSLESGKALAVLKKLSTKEL